MLQIEKSSGNAVKLPSSRKTANLIQQRKSYYRLISAVDFLSFSDLVAVIKRLPTKL